MTLRVSALLLIVLCAGLCVQQALAIDALPFKDHAQELRFQHLTKQLRCLVCQNESLADSGADLAKQLRGQIFQMMQSGKSDDEIKQYLVSRYNDYVLYDPPVIPSTWLLWFGPLLVFGVGVLIVAGIIRTRRRGITLAGAGRADVSPDDEDDW
ncbi:MAG: cytochrome c-type biogenesis protein [Rhodanobacteraceae bacterium]